jgi:putative tricarboxylic transport membrane protein
MTISGVVGFVLKKFDYELAPLVLAYVLGPLLEINFRLSLIMSDGDLSIFLIRPIPCVALGISALLFISACFLSYRKTKKKVDEMAED